MGSVRQLPILIGDTSWLQGRVTTMVKVTNLFNEDIQQHIFGDILKRQIVGELRVQIPR